MEGSIRRTTRAAAVLALTACLALGLAATASAVSGPASGVTAAAAQYPVTPPSTTAPSLGGTPPGGTAPGTATGTPATPSTSTPSSSTPSLPAPGQVKAVSTGQSPKSTAPTAAQQNQQVQATSSKGSLAFTGFAVLTILGLGLAALAAGLVLRRRTTQLS